MDGESGTKTVVERLDKRRLRCSHWKSPHTTSSPSSTPIRKRLKANIFPMHITGTGSGARESISPFLLQGPASIKK